MSDLAKSGLFYPNLFVRITLNALTEVVGENGMNTLYRMAGLSYLIGQLPPENQEKEFDFTDFSKLFQSLYDLFGEHGGKGLAHRAGKATFAEGMKAYGALFGVEDLALRDLPIAQKTNIALNTISELFNQLTDQQTSVQCGENEWIFEVQRCPVCWGRTADQPVCAVTEGMLDEALFTFSGGSKFDISETDCCAAGADACRFRITIPEPDNPPFTLEDPKRES